MINHEQADKDKEPEELTPNEQSDEQVAEKPLDNAENDSDLAALLAEARSKLDESQNELLRAHADMENLRRRQSRDLENAHKRALDRFVLELLPIYDSMELGLNATNDSDASLESVRTGLDMTMKMFLTSVGKFGLVQVSPKEGDAFNPELHQAMKTQKAEGVPPNQILSVVQKGYQFNGRLLRPAMIVVSQ